MLHIPALRFGKPYESLETIEIPHHRTREPIAKISQVGGGLIARDMRKMAAARRTLAERSTEELIAICAKAAGLFMSADLPIGSEAQPPQRFVEQQSATTGMPRALCRANMDKIAGVLGNMRAVLDGLTRGLDLRVLDGASAPRPSGSDCSRVPASTEDGPIVAYRSQSDCLGCVMPSNSPGVHGLWPPAITLKTPLVLKPGREEPWTPMRIMQALLAAGCPPEACGFYPTDHAGAGEILRLAGRSTLFGDVSTTLPYAGDARVQIHGPGWSKVLIGDDMADRWPEFVELMVSSIAANGGRSCLNASAVWTPRHGREIAEAVAKELAEIEARPAEDENARLCAFANPQAAEFFAGAIERDLKTPGAEDVTARFRDGERLIRLGECAYVLPTLVCCDSPDHPLANREFLLPYAAVVECPQEQMLARIGPTLVCTALTADERFADSLLASRDIDRLNIGPIPTWRIQWDQPHEGNLFEHLYTRRALQRAAIGRKVRVE